MARWARVGVFLSIWQGELVVCLGPGKWMEVLYARRTHKKDCRIAWDFTSITMATMLFFSYYRYIKYKHLERSYKVRREGQKMWQENVMQWWRNTVGLYLDLWLYNSLQYVASEQHRDPYRLEPWSSSMLPPWEKLWKRKNHGVSFERQGRLEWKRDGKYSRPPAFTETKVFLGKVLFWYIHSLEQTHLPMCSWLI